MQVQADVGVRFGRVAVSAVYPVVAVHADRHGATANPMLLGAMTIDALHILPAHVDVDAGAGKQQGFVHVAVFNGVATAALKVTAAAVLPQR